ncbi:MAG: hypothetical protein FPO08_00445 [Geobacter sp.]|nr:MAG: hypothetical protein FPO08_00445 [Geobacter sp.]
MKKSMVVATALAMGILSLGAVSASASSSCCTDNTCTDKQIVQQFEKETAETVRALKAKEVELRAVFSQDGVDSNRASELDSEIDKLKAEIKSTGERLGASPCCRTL